VTGEDDVGQLASLTFRYDYYKKEPWRLGLAYNHYHLIYFIHDELTLTGARPSAYAFWENGPTVAGLEYLYSHYWVGTESRADVHSFLPVVAHTYQDTWRNELRGNGETRNYLNYTPDDNLYGFAVTEYYLMRKGLAHVRAGFNLEYDETTSREFGSFVTHEFMMGFQWPVWRDRWFLDVSIHHSAPLETTPHLKTVNRMDNGGPQRHAAAWANMQLIPCSSASERLSLCLPMGLAPRSV
jgi:hypothetical protein